MNYRNIADGSGKTGTLGAQCIMEFIRGVGLIPKNSLREGALGRF